jgi:transglutaminase-like putative cysteine protease
LTTAQELRLKLTMPTLQGFVLDSGRQSLQDNILIIHRERLSAAAPVCAGQDFFLQATPYVQADHEQITKLATRLTEKKETALGCVRAIGDWVHENIDKRPVVGIPDAVTTLNNRVGDCNEHAALFAALARSAGIPAKIAAGVIFYQDSFYYHAWNEVCIGDSWLSVDTTGNQIPADVSHIKFVEGEAREMVKIGSLIGNLEIEIIPAQETNERNH